MKWYFWIIISLVFVVVGFVTFEIINNSRYNIGDQSKINQKNIIDNTILTKPSKLVFTHKIFDTDKVDYIVPLGELNGGGVEMQTLNGVMVQLDRKKIKDAPIDVFAPTDLELKYYTFIKDQNTPNGDWNLEFRIDNNHDLTINHLNNVGEILTSSIGVPANENGKPVDIVKPIKIKAGELIGTTRGTGLANNWNIYLYDKTKFPKNQFVNQRRFENGGYLGERFLNSVCPFDYYSDEIKQSYYVLLGASASGQTTNCGSPSKDKSSTISGIWFLDKEGIKENYVGDYSNPLSVYKKSDGNVIIYELGKKFYTIAQNKLSYKSPEEVTISHCYDLRDDWSGAIKSGYIFFRVDSESEMSLAYSPVGSCPREFPTQSQKYFR